MDDMQVYIANLGKYNEGELVGAWFTFPIDFEEVKEKIGLNDEYEEYAIHDYELPFTVDEYTSIGELNRLWEMVSELPEELQSELSALLTHFSSIEELSEHQEDIIIHSDCDDMYDVARYLAIRTCSTKLVWRRRWRRWRASESRSTRPKAAPRGNWRSTPKHSPTTTTALSRCRRTTRRFLRECRPTRRAINSTPCGSTDWTLLTTRTSARAYRRLPRTPRRAASICVSASCTASRFSSRPNRP